MMALYAEKENLQKQIVASPKRHLDKVNQLKQKLKVLEERQVRKFPT